MTNRFVSPDQQFFSNPTTGAPLAGGFLYFYATGSSTPRNTYSDSGLTIPNLNPIVLDSNGYSGDIFLSQAPYKVVLTDSNSVQLWTADPVWTSDYSTVAQFTAYNGNPNGLVAGTAGTQGGLPSSVIWDYAHNILYVATTTGSSSTTIWTAVNASTTATSTSVPQGYLTVTSGTPIIPSDVTAATAVYYTPYIGNTVPIYSGSAFTTQTFAELTLTLSASQALNTIYDVFAFNNSGTITIVTGPAWSTSTAGSGTRGTGAGTTQISRLNGLWVNAVQITGINGASTYTIPANQATYLGSLSIDGSAGQVSCYRSFGQSRKWGVWNAYNRVPIILQAGDTTASWTYATNTIRASNGSSANSLSVFNGLAEELAACEFVQQIQESNPNGAPSASISIGLNSTTAASGRVGQFLGGTGATTTLAVDNVAKYIVPPSLGINTINCQEVVANIGGGTVTFFGTSAHMILTAQWRA